MKLSTKGRYAVMAMVDLARHAQAKPVSLSESRRTAVRDKFRDKFRGEEPVVEQGLQCVKCHRVYPIVSDIPVMLVEEAFEEA